MINTSQKQYHKPKKMKGLIEINDFKGEIYWFFKKTGMIFVKSMQNMALNMAV